MKYFLTTLLMCMTILAESKNDLFKVASDSGNFKILISAVQEAGLSSALKSDGPLTILAPSDEAFGKLPKGTLEELLEPANKERLIRLLKFHVISGDFSAIQLLSGEVETLNGEFILSKIVDGQLALNNSKIVVNDIVASNGRIHVIDRVLIPSPSLTKAQKMTQLIESAVKKGVRLYNNGEHQSCVEIYSLALESLILWDGGLINSELKSSINQSLKTVKGSHEADKNAWALRKILDKVYTDLSHVEKKNEVVSTFKPIIESQMPKGFPKPGPLNKVILKKYPEYRQARVESGGQGSTFMKLFFHIKKSGIGMTSPVEMTLDKNNQSRQNMAFIYANQSIGQVGDKGNGVEVIDMPAKTFLSLGIRGSESKDKIVKAIDQIKAYMSDNKQWQLNGEPRLLGYNSPMIPRENRYWEVQLPVSAR